MSYVSGPQKCVIELHSCLSDVSIVQTWIWNLDPYGMGLETRCILQPMYLWRLAKLLPLIANCEHRVHRRMLLPRNVLRYIRYVALLPVAKDEVRVELISKYKPCFRRKGNLKTYRKTRESLMCIRATSSFFRDIVSFASKCLAIFKGLYNLSEAGCEKLRCSLTSLQYVYNMWWYICHLRYMWPRFRKVVHCIGISDTPERFWNCW